MEINNKFVFYSNVVIGVFLLIATICFMQLNVTPYITKTIASVIFVLCGVFNLDMIYREKELTQKWKSILLLCGLVFAMLGDIVLIDYFVIGAILFAVGHIFFFIYFCSLQKFTLWDFGATLTLVVCAILLITLCPIFEFNGMLPMIIAYAIIISLMLGKAIGNCIAKRSTENLVSMIGALLFFFSDIMLLFYVFGGEFKVFDYLCVYTYYPAEFLLAISIFLQGKSMLSSTKN